MGKNKTKAYVPEALEFFKKSLERIRQPVGDANIFSESQIDREGLQKAVQALPKKDRERIEKFWGLTGGPNHSKKMVRFDAKDVAFNEMCNMAITSMRKLLTLDYIIMYNPKHKTFIDLVGRKIDKNGMEISNVECAKLLMAFYIYIENGPKMSFEEDPMMVDTELNGALIFDEYEVMKQMCEEISRFPDKSINIKLLISLLEMMDFKDWLAIKKSIGIEIPKDCYPEEVKVIRTVARVREFKERVFPYGAWEVTCELIQGNVEGKIKLDDFMEAVDSIRKDWSKVVNFKNGQKKLQTLNELRTLDVYNIGGLEFTDIYEIMFLYLERNLITSVN